MLVLDPAPGLHIVDINDAHGRATMTNRRGIAGEQLFDVFPDSPGEPSTDGVSNLYTSLKIAAQTGKPHTMAGITLRRARSNRLLYRTLLAPAQYPAVRSGGTSHRPAASSRRYD